MVSNYWSMVVYETFIVDRCEMVSFAAICFSLLRLASVPPAAFPLRFLSSVFSLPFISLFTYIYFLKTCQNADKRKLIIALCLHIDITISCIPKYSYQLTFDHPLANWTFCKYNEINDHKRYIKANKIIPM